MEQTMRIIAAIVHFILGSLFGMVFFIAVMTGRTYKETWDALVVPVLLPVFRLIASYM